MNIGFKDAPFNLKYRFPFSSDKVLKFAPNPNQIIGFGIHYFGFGLAFNFKLPITIRNERLYGNTKYFDIKLVIQLKQWVLEASFKRYKGFAISNLPELDPSYIENSPLGIRSDLLSWTIYSNLKYFFNKKFDYNSVRGFTGRCLKSTYSLYAMNVINGYVLDGKLNPFLHESVFVSSYSFSKLSKLSVFEFGFLPGIVGVVAHKSFNLGIHFAIGPVLQYHKSFRQKEMLGRIIIAPKIDFGLNLGINKPNWFFKLFIDYDWKISNFNAYNYFHNYYRIMLKGGYRLKIKTPKFLKKMKLKF